MPNHAQAEADALDHATLTLTRSTRSPAIGKLSDSALAKTLADLKAALAADPEMSGASYLRAAMRRVRNERLRRNAGDTTATSATPATKPARAVRKAPADLPLTPQHERQPAEAAAAKPGRAAAGTRAATRVAGTRKRTASVTTPRIPAASAKRSTADRRTGATPAPRKGKAVPEGTQVSPAVAASVMATEAAKPRAAKAGKEETTSKMAAAAEIAIDAQPSGKKSKDAPADPAAKAGKKVKAGKIAKAEKAAKGEKAAKAEKSAKSKKSDKSANKEKSGKKDKSGKKAKSGQKGEMATG